MLPLHHLLTECAPMVAPSTMAAIVQVESGGNPLAMWNNNTRSMVIPGNRQQAIRYLRQAIAAGQRVDAGIAQVDTENFAAFGLTPRTAFNGCANLHTGAEILRQDWNQALASGYRGQQALYHAFEAYNSGKLRGDTIYANRILSAAGVPVFVHRERIRLHPSSPYPQFRWTVKPSPAVKPTLAARPSPVAVADSWPVLP